ncbi:hypothetical protein [Arachidicoccus ginsenosidivorans]|uniref:hypothetical protein n=1 Tax=Arachidicoccus ginsenosidivorans TaxID=496057 RepID=UPI003743CFC0
MSPNRLFSNNTSPEQYCQWGSVFPETAEQCLRSLLTIIMFFALPKTIGPFWHNRCLASQTAVTTDQAVDILTGHHVIVNLLACLGMKANLTVLVFNSGFLPDGGKGGAAVRTPDDFYIVFLFVSIFNLKGASAGFQA